VINVGSALRKRKGWSGATFSSFFSALAPFTQALHGQDLAETRLVKRLRTGARAADAVARPRVFDSDAFFDPRTVLDYVESYGPLQMWTEEATRQALTVLLAADLAFRGGESVRLIRYKLEIDDKGLRGFLWWPKEQRKPALVRSTVRHAHDPTKGQSQKSCTPCVAAHYRTLVPDAAVRKDVEIGRPAGSKEKDVVRTSSFIATSKGPRRSLGAQRAAKECKRLNLLAGLDPKFKAHSWRGAASSKCANLGMRQDLVKQRTRHSSRSQTWEKSYFRPEFYAEADPHRFANGPWEDLVRMHVTSV